ncbi:MAG: ATP-binding protein [Mycobacteriales bacterium]
MLLMLAGAALFVYLRLRADLDDAVDASLRSRVESLLAVQGGPTLVGVALEDTEESFVQLLSAEGDVVATVGTLRGAALTPAEARLGATREMGLERRLPGVDGRARLLSLSGPGGDVVVAGQSLRDRDDALANVVSSFVLGGAVAILLASAIGYLLATAAFRPVEAMRRRASEVSLLPADAGLPLPAARDEIRLLGETLNAMLARLRAAFERESRFVADASHELRTPIAIIKTELEGALQVADPGSPVHSSLVGAVEECDRLAQLAEDLLVIASSTDGRLAIRPELTAAHVLLGSVRDRFADRAGRRGREIRVESEPDLVMLADPVRISQALGNLVENALRHGAGDVLLRARSASLNGWIEVDVIDAGPGFPAALAARAFERFSRGDRARSGEGVGLGLSIVQAIAEAHGGSAAIVAASRTTLRLALPSAA